MKKIISLSFLFLGMIFLSGCIKQSTSQIQPTNSAPATQKKELPKNNIVAQSDVPTETLNYCDRSFVAEKVELDGASIVNRILQLAIAKDKDNCINFEQINNIAVLKKVDGNMTSITLYEKNSLTDADRQLPIDKQLEKIQSNERYPQANEYVIKGDLIYMVSKFDGEEQLLGKLK